jgi:hypothetical protein
MGYDVGDDIDMGDLDDVGAVRRRSRYGASRRALQVRPSPANVQQVPGVSPVAMKRMVLGLGSLFFAVAQPLTSQTLSVQPQVPFKGERLVIAVGRTGTTAAGPLLTITAFSIGIKDQRGGFNPIGVDVFGATATEIELVMDPAGPGVTITLTISTTAIPTTTDRIDVNASIIGMGIS